MKIYLVFMEYHNTDPDFFAFTDKERALDCAKQGFVEGVAAWEDDDPYECTNPQHPLLYSASYGEEGDGVQVWEIELDE